MKKVGLILLALVLALGVLGVGYAMWSDTLLINGTVNTGTVDINVGDSTTYSGTSVLKVIGAHDGYTLGQMVVIEIPDDMDLTAYNTLIGSEDFEVVAIAKATSTDEDEINFTFNNLFPVAGSYTNGYLSYCADIGIDYDGSIPVHIAVEGKTTGDAADKAILDWLFANGYATINFEVYDGSATPVMKYAGNYTDGTLSFTTGTPPIQMHGGYSADLEICIFIPQTFVNDAPEYYDVDDNTQEWLSGLNAGFVAKIVAYQWNESAPDIVLP